MSLHKLFQSVITMSLMGSVVAGIIILIKALLKDKFNAAFHYYIWLLLMVRLLIPYVPETSFSIFNLVPQVIENIERYTKPQFDVGHNLNLSNIDDGGQAPQREDDTRQALNGGLEDKADTIDNLNDFFKAPFWIKAAKGIWAAGVLVVLLYNLGIYSILLYKINNMPECVEDNMMEILERLGKGIKTKKLPRIVYSPQATAPSLFGYFKPKILISHHLAEELSHEELEYVFLHEMVHLRRKDILINWIMVIIQALHWFNPVVWYAFRKMRSDCEIACDAHVLAYLEPEKRKDYGKTIISLLEILSKPYWNPGAIGLATNKSDLKRRIIMIKKFNKIPFRWTIIAVATIILIGGIGLTNGLTKAKDLGKPPLSTKDNDDVTLVQENQMEENRDTSVEDAESSKMDEAQEVTDTDNSLPQKPQVLVEVDMEVVKRDQKQVDEGHSPWQLSPLAVVQTFVGLQISPDGIQGDFPVDTEDMEIIYETNEVTIVEIGGEKTPIAKVFLKRLVRQDDDGIWTVVGYDPVDK